MENVPDTKLGGLYRAHIEFILKKDIAALLNQYTDDCLLISSFMKEPRYYRGKQELNEHMQGILGIEGLQTSIRFWAETDNTLMVTEDIALTAGGQVAQMIFADSWVLRDGKIAIHFAGMVQHPDGSLA
jgi:ketosteroid isomerase-like protein